MTAIQAPSWLIRRISMFLDEEEQGPAWLYLDATPRPGSDPAYVLVLFVIVRDRQSDATITALGRELCAGVDITCMRGPVDDAGAAAMASFTVGEPRLVCYWP